jgi:putative CocE/NonD family hydrolase
MFKPSVRPSNVLAVLSIVALVLIAVGSPGNLWAQTDDGLTEYIRANFSKFEYWIPMRDGARLYTSVYVPNDTSQSYPMLMIRTPYSCNPYGADRYPEHLGPTRKIVREGYIFVCQDVRGRFMSEGVFVNMRPHRDAKNGPKDVDESTDTYDTIEWLIHHVEGNNGRVGQWGNSYPGFYTAAGAVDSHPALKAVSPNAPIADWYWDDMHHNGAFTLGLSFPFFTAFGRPRPEPTTEWPDRYDFKTPDSYQFFLDLGPLKNVEAEILQGDVAFWTATTEHPDYDRFWQSRNIVPHLNNISCAVLTVGGWFDAEDLYGPLHIYPSIERKNPGIFNVIVMGPWRHGAWLYSDGRTLGPADFGYPTAEEFRARAIEPFFRHFLKGEGEVDLPEAWMFETGANRWREFDSWPPPQLETRTFYLGEGGSLGDRPPQGADDEAFDEYPSDPANPVPYTPAITVRWHSEYMVEDQRFAARRPDVLVFRSEPLEADLTLAGPITARLWVATTGTGADWVVKLIDEYPGRMPGYEAPSREQRYSGDFKDEGGTQRMVRSEIFRGRYRKSYERPEAFVPNEITLVEIPLQDVLHTFKRGHRVMIQVQSSLFPLFDRNPQTYVDNIFEADEEDFVKATHRVWFSKDHPSSIEFGVLPTLAAVAQPVVE